MWIYKNLAGGEIMKRATAGAKNPFYFREQKINVFDMLERLQRNGSVHTIIG